MRLTVGLSYMAFIQALFTDPEEMCPGFFNLSAHSLPITHEQFFLQPQYDQELAFFYCRSKLNGLYYKYLLSLV